MRLKNLQKNRENSFSVSKLSEVLRSARFARSATNFNKRTGHRGGQGLCPLCSWPRYSFITSMFSVISQYLKAMFGLFVIVDSALLIKCGSISMPRIFFALTWLRRASVSSWKEKSNLPVLPEQFCEHIFHGRSLCKI